MRFEKLSRLGENIDEEFQEVSFSTAAARKKRDHWGKEHEVFSSFLEKVACEHGEDQATFLLHHLRKL